MKERLFYIATAIEVMILLIALGFLAQEVFPVNITLYVLTGTFILYFIFITILKLWRKQ